MTYYTLQINFELNVKPEDYLTACEHAVNAIAEVPQLEWKLWILSEDGKRAGGWYLFQDRASAEAYANGPIIGRLRESGMTRNMEVHVFCAVESLTRSTRGALVLPIAASKDWMTNLSLLSPLLVRRKHSCTQNADSRRG